MGRCSKLNIIELDMFLCVFLSTVNALLFLLVSPLLGKHRAEVQNELVQVSQSFSESLARQKFTDSCERALNEQIHVEYNVSYIYHALFAFFDRDNVGLPGFAKYFKLPPSKRNLRAYHLPDEEQKPIQMITALVLQLVQCSVTFQETTEATLIVSAKCNIIDGDSNPSKCFEAAMECG